MRSLITADWGEAHKAGTLLWDFKGLGRNSKSASNCNQSSHHDGSLASMSSLVSRYGAMARIVPDSQAAFFASFLTFAHRFFAALAIAALPAADKTRFFTPMTSRSAEPP